MRSTAVLLAGLVTAFASLPAEAGGDPAYAYGPRVSPHAHRPLPPEMRYRDPRFVPPPPRRARVFGPPPVLIQAYLPRYTERPMYNEPPSRFPR